MSDTDSFQLNIDGVRNLIGDDTNKTRTGDTTENEGVVGQYEDILELPMPDEELLALKEQWEGSWNAYYPKVKVRQQRNKTYYEGKQLQDAGQNDKVIPSNLIFEAEETFIPQALSKNPEPVVWSDNSEEGKKASNEVKTMLQYHADILCLRKKLGVMTRHWSIYFFGVVKHGWDPKVNDITTEIRKPQNFILDPNGYVDEFGNFKGKFLGERIESTAGELIELFPKHKEYILIKANGKLGTNVVRTEWWTDEYCFTTFEDEVLDKHKNEFFNYDKTEKGVDGYGIETQTVTPGLNHFAVPKMPYTFLSVFSLQERPHDITNLIEQNVANQDRITSRDAQIDKNLKIGNNSLAVSELAGFNAETAREAAQALEDGDPILVPGTDNIDSAIKRLPANEIPSSLFQAQENDKNTLRSVFGTQGLTASAEDKDRTARGMILNANQDSSRIGGGVGDALEQVADNIFNWWLQLYCVFYDLPHYGAVMGNGRAVEYVMIVNTNLERRFVVSVVPNSTKPKDEISEQNIATERWAAKSIDPIGYMKAINDPDPIESAKRLVLWITNPALYVQQYFPEAAPQPAMGGGQPPDMGGGGGEVEPVEPDISAAPPGSNLSEVPLSSPAVPTQ